MTTSLRVAIVHHHLRRGGVTRVILHAVDALRRRGVSAALLVGERPGEAVEESVPLEVLEGLGYASRREAPAPARLVDGLLRAARSALGAVPDIWHFHNHSLGKNPALPCAVHRLAESGSRLLLQIHDFAEDARPGNYRLLRESLGERSEGLGLYLYPQAPHVHYTVLNNRDRRVLLRAGVAPSRLHLLGNAIDLDVDGGAAEKAAAGGGRLFLYPTRAIRRKNLGEFLLWSLLAEDGERFATTLAPANPAEQPRYRRWVEFSRRQGLPVDFGIGEAKGASFPALMESARCLVTTSVAEGFGMSFLEPWLFLRPVAGRDLPDITRDFAVSGVDLGDLYERLEVPLEWVGEEVLRKKIERQLGSSLAAYGRELRVGDVDRALNAAVRDRRVDFGKLDEELQEAVIRGLRAGQQNAAELRPQRLLSSEVSPETIRRNADSVRRRFNLDAYGDSLLRIYRRLVESPTGTPEALDAERILDQLLDPERFCLLRT